MLAGVIREGHESDFAAATALVNRVWPYRVGSATGWRHSVRAEPAEARLEISIEGGERPLGS